MTMSCRAISSGERSPPFEPIGTRDIISTPAETTTSSSPARIAVAALKFVCIDEPHWRSTDVPHTVSGQPAISGTIRPMFQPCSPICVTQPICTSSTSPGSTPVPLDERVQDAAPRARRRACRKRPVPPPDRRAEGVDDQRVAHAPSLRRVTA